MNLFSETAVFVNTKTHTLQAQQRHCCAKVVGNDKNLHTH